MTAIDWSRPLVTNAGKVARVVDGPHSVTAYRQALADWDNDGEACRLWCCPRGVSNINDRYSIRNATPSEILANPEAWPDWQDWARQHLVRQMEIAPNGTVKLRPARPEPGVMVTRETAVAAFATAVERCQSGETLLPHLLDALGLPPEPPKVAPWEEAYEAEWAEKPSDEVRRGVALIWGMVEAECQTWFTANGWKALRRRIMGDQA